MVILVVASLYIFICLYKFFSLFERKKDYERKTENGTLKITRATINNYVTDLLRKDPDITGIKTTSELKGNKFLIYVKCELLAKINIADKIAQLQNLIKKVYACCITLKSVVTVTATGFALWKKRNITKTSRLMWQRLNRNGCGVM